MNELIVEVDSRQRVSLNRVKTKHDRYIVTEEAGGTLILEPAVVLTRDEHNYLAHPDLVAAVEHSRQHPEQRRERPARATR